MSCPIPFVVTMSTSASVACILALLLHSHAKNIAAVAFRAARENIIGRLLKIYPSTAIRRYRSDANARQKRKKKMRCNIGLPLPFTRPFPPAAADAASAALSVDTFPLFSFESLTERLHWTVLE